MADKGIDRNVNFGGNQLKNFVLWLRTTAQAAANLLITGAMAYDTDKDVVSVKTSGDIRDLQYAEKQIVATTDIVLMDAYNGALVFTEQACMNVTISTGLADGFTCQFMNGTDQEVEFSCDGSLTAYDGTTLGLGKYCTVFKRNDDDSYYLKGEMM